MSSIKELAKEMDIKLPSYAVKPINDMIAKYKKNNKISGDISNKLKKQAIKKHMNRLTKKPHGEEYSTEIAGALSRGKAKKRNPLSLNVSYKKGGSVKYNKIPDELSELKKYLEQLTVNQLMQKKNKNALRDYQRRTGKIFKKKGGHIKAYAKGGGVRKPKMTAGY